MGVERGGDRQPARPIAETLSLAHHLASHSADARLQHQALTAASVNAPRSSETAAAGTRISSSRIRSRTAVTRPQCGLRLATRIVLLTACRGEGSRWTTPCSG